MFYNNLFAELPKNRKMNSTYQFVKQNEEGGGVPNELLCAREESCEGNVSSTFFDPDFPVLK